MKNVLIHPSRENTVKVLTDGLLKHNNISIVIGNLCIISKWFVWKNTMHCDSSLEFSSRTFVIVAQAREGFSSVCRCNGVHWVRWET